MPLFLGACVSTHSYKEFSKQIELPKQTKTRATDYLGCFGDMLTSYRQGGKDLDLLRLAVVSVKDSTNVSTVSSQLPSEIPNDFTDMTLSIISRIGGPIRVIHIPGPQELFDAARYGSIPGKKPPFFETFKASHYRADTLQIYGALTEYDRLVKNTQKDGDLSIEAGGGSGITNLEISSSGVTNVARMTMDFRVVYAAVGDVVNNSSSSNTVTVYQRGLDRSFGLSVDGNSIGYGTSRSVVDARHKAIRMLIEWGLIETIGRYALVPYWKCLPNSENKPMTGFKDIVSNNSLYSFHNINLAGKKNKSNKKSDLVDMRDKLLINAVISDFNNAEYLKQQTRRLLRRPEQDTTLIQRKSVNEKIVESKSIIEGKSTLRRNLLQLYKRDKRYAKLSDIVLLKRLHNEFVKAKILSSKDPIMGEYMYTAMWLNAPVIRNARWRR